MQGLEPERLVRLVPVLAVVPQRIDAALAPLCIKPASWQQVPGRFDAVLYAVLRHHLGLDVQALQDLDSRFPGAEFPGVGIVRQHVLAVQEGSATVMLGLGLVS